VVTVPVAETVYVIGEVRKPGEVALRGNATISVLQALSSAEGFGLTPAPQAAKIVRSVPGTTERKEIPVDLKKVIAERPRTLPCAERHPGGPAQWSKKAAARAVEAAIQTATGSSYGAILRSSQE